MANEYTNKVVLSSGETLIDLTNDTVTANKVLSTYTFHLASGAPATGNCTYDADTSDATATVSEILAGKTAYKNGAKLTGTMPNKGSVTGSISSKTGTYAIPQGFHDGGGSIGIAAAEQAKIVAGNIKSGVNILGVTGTYSGEAGSAQSKTTTPTFAQQLIQPDAGYDYLSTVTVNAIPVVYTDNPAGGKTCTIG